MGWFFFGLLSAFGIEMFIRVASGYEAEPRERQKRVQVSLPWYGWAGAAYFANRATKSKRRSRL